MTQQNEVEIAVIKADMTNMAKDISDIKTDVKTIMVQLNKQPSLEAKIISLEKEIHEIRQSSNLWKWLAPTLTAVLTASVTFLLMQYIQRL